MYIGGGVTKILHSTSDNRSGREGKHTARRVGQGSLQGFWREGIPFRGGSATQHVTFP